MPHLIVEYSANIESEIDLPRLMKKLRDSAVQSGVMAPGGIRVRAARRDQYLIADGDPDNGFVHIMVRLGHGRPIEVRKQFSDQLYTLASEHLNELFDQRGFGLSIELVEIEPETSRKRNSLHARLNAKRSARGHRRS